MPGVDVIYTLFPFGLPPEQVLTWYAFFYECRIIFWLSHRVCFPVSSTSQPWLLVYLIWLSTYESQGCFIEHTVLKLWNLGFKSSDTSSFNFGNNINVGSLALYFLSCFPCVDNLRHLLLLAIKPGFGQQLSRRVAFGADTLLGQHRKHSTQASRHINKNWKWTTTYLGGSARPLRDADISFISIVPAHKAKWKYIHYAAQE
jgi:hypothetical protein